MNQGDLGPLPDPQHLFDHDEAAQAFADILDARASEDEIEAFPCRAHPARRNDGRNRRRRRSMRERLIPIDAPAGAIDVCGTGGDGHHTLNVSTAVSIVVAACEVPVAKHGNRAASSKAGAADTLEALGLDMERAGANAEATLKDLGICFLFAANHHPAMKRIQPIRQRIGKRTIFNLMGPLANPARVKRQLIGIARPAYVPVYAEALHHLGTEHSRIISGDEGLDELSLAGGNEVAVVEPEGVRFQRTSAADAGLPVHPVEAIRGGDAEHTCTRIAEAVAGRTWCLPRRCAVQRGRGVVGRGCRRNMPEGVEEAAEAIDKGLANALLNCWIAYK